VDRDAELEQAAEVSNLGFDLGSTDEDSEALHPRKALVEQVTRALLGGKLHPVLVGEPGVGKTAVAATLARALHGRRMGTGPACEEIGVPDELLGRQVIQVTVAEMIAGAIYANQLEDKVKRIVDNCRKRGAILFFDGALSFVGAGTTLQDPLSDIAGLVTPFLARGVLQAIAAATPADWMAVARLRPAFARLFTPILVPETASRETREILGVRAADWSSRYGFRIGEDAIAEAMDLADRLFPWKRFPGKACDLIEATLASIASAAPGPSTPAAAPFQRGAVRRAPPPLRQLRPAELANAVRRLYGLPDFLLVPSIPASRVDLARFFRSRVVGQEHVIDRLIGRVQMIKSRLCAPGRPLAAYLFAGPTGVGKTLVARTLAALLLGDERHLIRFDMSEFSTPDAVSRFLGQDRPLCRNPGLVDHATAEVFPVILLDEIEKAHHSVFDVLLQALGEGRLSDECGRTAHLTNAIFVMTSNLGTDRASIGHPRPADDANGWDDRVRTAVRNSFRPEFINRLTGVFTFRPLSREQVETIAWREVGHLALRHGLAARGMGLELSPEAFDAVLAAGYSLERGVREMERAVDLLVGTAVAAYLAESPSAGGCTVLVDVEAGSEPARLAGVVSATAVRPLVARPKTAATTGSTMSDPEGPARSGNETSRG
jgi:ATP-dependent Clp protease ATP-binding subunit ClpC